MATYVDILKSEFPEIDSEVFDYITGETPETEPSCCRCAHPGGAVLTGLYSACYLGPLLCSYKANKLLELTEAGALGRTAWTG